MSTEICQSAMQQINMYREIKKSEQQIVLGEIKDAKESLSQMRDKYGLSQVSLTHSLKEL